MLRFEFTDISDETVVFEGALSMTINAEESAPADSLTAVFKYRDIPELKAAAVLDDGETVFKGIIDEQQRIQNEKGAFLRIKARSMAALLLDNESVPVTYSHPSAGLICERHVKPYGIALSDSDDMESAYFGELVITKGTSDWQALSDFCEACFSCSPRITSFGELRMRPVSDDEEIVFSDGADGISYTEFRESKKRVAEISRVNVKVTNSSGYHNSIDNDSALKRGIVRERYLNAVLTQTPMRYADMMIRNGEENSYALFLSAPQRFLGELGQNVKVKSEMMGDIDGLYLSSLRYTLNSSGERTEIQLKRRIS